MGPIVPVLIGCWCFSGMIPLVIERDRIRDTVFSFADRLVMSDDQDEYDAAARTIFIGTFVFALVAGPYLLIKILIQRLKS